MSSEDAQAAAAEATGNVLAVPNLAQGAPPAVAAAPARESVAPPPAAARTVQCQLFFELRVARRALCGSGDRLLARRSAGAPFYWWLVVCCLSFAWEHGPRRLMDGDEWQSVNAQCVESQQKEAQVGLPARSCQHQLTEATELMVLCNFLQSLAFLAAGYWVCEAVRVALRPGGEFDQLGIGTVKITERAARRLQITRVVCYVVLCVPVSGFGAAATCLFRAQCLSLRWNISSFPSCPLQITCTIIFQR
eukprot:SAG11_NODE_7297_length_1165_cov_1.080675_1_plen_249_part_00